MPGRHVARDITYANSVRSRGGRALVRVLENATGRIGLIKRAEGYEHDIAAGKDFWGVMVARYGLSLDVVGGSLSNLPAEGPLVVIANHPYGILDGLMMGHILSIVRGDFRILANNVFRKAEDLNKVILPISFEETKEAMRENLLTRKTALSYLDSGGAIGVFPGGTVSTSAKFYTRPMDPGWRSFTARMVAKSNATVVPIFFEGHNSRLFQFASHLHSTLRLALLLKEFKKRMDEPVRVVIGNPIDQERLAEKAGDSRAMMDFLRAETYALSPRPLKSLDYGFEFDEKYRDEKGEKGHRVY
ncbi:lysophospholipid acyltransferase family protein [Aliiruegeria sabulilitoris]|uniref:lysophospholipid acyltransferase family protein n=1 Tax=Aliiruegeria sabulilitoris TaxID=1510458 RepID=UPI0008377210|nr:lysophospholipid acyltransferase family protein [Aliiruegeria sabulilitoris]NDR56520.1 acyltransferase [Pseudoruegeria sp. M32A2M]